MNYYNDNDPTAVASLRELMDMNMIPRGEIDERSIVDVKPNELVGYRQCHFFAGCGGWVEALRLAGWGEVENVWSGSAPCPPFSQAGKKKYCLACEGGSLIAHPYETGVFCCCACGYEWFADGRHLWPEFLRLIRERKPAFVFGEQVAGTDGEVWLAGVRATLEREGYGAWGSDLCAAGVGSAQIRQRLFWVGFTPGARPQSGKLQSIGQYGFFAQDGGVDENMASAESARRRMVESAHERERREEIDAFANAGATSNLDMADNESERCDRWRDSAKASRRSIVEASSSMVRAYGAGSQSREQAGEAAGYGRAVEPASNDVIFMEHAARAREFAIQQSGKRHGVVATSADAQRIIASPWADFELVSCQDACVRRIETGTFPLVSAGVDEKTTRYQLARMLRRLVPGRNIRERRRKAKRLAADFVFAKTRRAEPAAQPVVDGIPAGMVRGHDSGISQAEWEEAQASAEGRVIRLRAYGNAIVPWLAAEFVSAFQEGLEEINQ